MALSALATLTKRLVKGSPLTLSEGDNNWSAIEAAWTVLQTKLGITLNDDGSVKRPLVIKGDSSTGNQTYMIEPTSPAFVPGALADLTGLLILVKPDFTNTSSAATLRVLPLTTNVSIRKQGTKAIVANDILTGQYALFHYDGTYFQLLNPAADLPADYEDTIPNGSFEVDATGDNLPDEWVIAPFPGGGGGVLEATDVAHGAKSLKFTHPGGATGGGTAETTKYFECAEQTPVVLRWLHKCSAAALLDKVELVFFDKAKAALSTVAIYSSSSNPTSWALQSGGTAPPANARFFKVRITGGDPSAATAGTSHWDGVEFLAIAAPEHEFSITTPGTHTWVCPAGVRFVLVEVWGAGGGGGGGQSGGGNGGGGGAAGAFARKYVPVTPSTTYTLVVGAKGAGGTFSVDGASGQQSHFNSAVIGGGGGGGVNGAGSGVGGTGGTASGGDINVNGNAGSNRSGTAGGTGGRNVQNGFAGGAEGAAPPSHAPGHGGGGGRGTGSPTAGGNGNDGLVVLKWTVLTA